MIETLQNIDESLFLALHNLGRGDFMDTAMWWISDRWIWIPMYFAIVWWMSRRLGWRSAVVYAIAIGAAVACADQLCATVIRPMVERLRPANLMNPLSDSVNIVNDYRGGRYGFPSCHAANTFVLATFVALVSWGRTLKIWLFVWAVLNCYSRIYLGVHYPGDLVVGAGVGAGCSWLIWTMIRLTGMSEQRSDTASSPTRFSLPVLVGAATLAVIIVIALF